MNALVGMYIQENTIHHGGQSKYRMSLACKPNWSGHAWSAANKLIHGAIIIKCVCRGICMYSHACMQGIYHGLE